MNGGEGGGKGEEPRFQGEEEQTKMEHFRHVTPPPKKPPYFYWRSELAGGLLLLLQPLPVHPPTSTTTNLHVCMGNGSAGIHLFGPVAALPPLHHQ